MCLRQNRRFIVLLFTYLALISVKAQTLYWVGGSGNFNDPNHWSLTSGGGAANEIPNAGTAAIFNDNSAVADFSVQFTGASSSKSIKAQTETHKVSFTGDQLSQLNVFGDFIFNNNVNPLFETKLVYSVSSGNSDTKYINFSGKKINSNVDFLNGNWSLISFYIGDQNTVKFLNGNFYIDHVHVKAGNFISETGLAKFIITNGVVRVKDKFSIGKNTTFENNNAYFDVHPSDPAKYLVDKDVSLGASGKLIGGSNQVAACGVTLASQAVSCNGISDGKLFITIDVTCANGPFQLIWNNPGGLCTNATLTGVAAGTYTINNMAACAGQYEFLLVDASNNPLVNSNQVNIPGPGQISFNFFGVIMPSCFGDCNGSITAVLGGGTPNFSIQLTPPTGPLQNFTGQTSGVKTFPGLCTGLYSFLVSDASGCSRSFTQNVNQPAVLSANPNTSSITCNTYSNGGLSISPLGGTPNYTVNYSNGSSQVTGTLGTVLASGLAPGPISATVTDSKGCSTNVNSIIIQPGVFAITPTQTNVACNGASTGVARVQVSGATPPYTYNWSPASGSSSIITNLAIGPQTVNIADANSCTTSATYNITEPPAITLTPTSTNVVCSGSCTGIASVAASGGVGGFSFTWVGSGNATLSVGAQNTLSNLCAGNYTIYVRDTPNNCLTSIVIPISQPPALTLTAVSRSVSCFGASDGSATVTATGGNSSGYTYTWTPGAMSTSVITGLGPNVYNLTVRDASLCPTFTSVTIIEPAGLVPSVTFTNLTCNAANNPCNGRINAAPVGGTTPYSYTLTTPGFTVFTAPPYNNLCAATYSVMVKDVSGCPQQSVVTLTQPNPLVPTISTTSVICFGGNTGGLTGSPGSGGTPSYNLTWATPAGAATGAILSNQLAGNYTLFVVDQNTCTAQTTATVTQPSSITVSAGSSTISCYSLCNGVLTSTVTGGTPPYTYAWTNSLSVNVGAAATATGLCPGPYTLTVTDFNLCTRTVSGTVFSPGPIVLTATTTPVNCFGDANGSATVTASGGTPSFTFQFNSAPTVLNTTGVLAGQPTGSYIATITDFAGCIQTTTFAITSPTALAATLTGTGSCNVCTGSTTLTPSFGTPGPGYTYSWTSSLGPVALTTPTLANLCAGSYTGTVTDSKGCSTTRSILLNQIVTVTVSLGGTSILCNGASTGSATASASGGTGIYTYSWTPSGQTNSVISNVTANTYTVKVTDTSIPSTCAHTATITLNQPPAITVATTKTNVTCYGYSNGAITTTFTGGTGAPTYSWSPGAQTTPSISNIAAGSYTLKVTDGNLCTNTQVISIAQSPSIAITFTPVNPSGCAVLNGSICTTPSGGSGAGYTFTWSPVAGGLSCLTGLNGGTYQHTVTDGAGCSNTVAVTLFNATGPTLTAVTRSVDCFGANTGSATISASGAGPFTFTWSPATVNSVISPNTTATGLGNGSYVITSRDINGCVTNTSIVITQPSSVTINSAATNARCFNVCNGSITVGPTGGAASPTYVYNWLPAAPPIAGQGTRTITNLCSGPYTLNLTTNPNSCLTQYTFAINQPPNFTISAVTSSLLCNNACTGSIVANAAGGTGGINYSWTPVGGSSQTVTGLCATTGTNPSGYTLTILDAQQCTATAVYTVGQPLPLTNTVSAQVATCSNSCNAIATQTADGGVGGYSYSWSSSTLTAASLGSLCAGNYTAFVTDANGCSNSRTYTVIAPAPLNVTLTPVNPLCNAACNGSVATSVSGAQGAVSYTWAPAGSGQSPTGLCAAPNPIYTLVAMDANNCRVTAVTTLTNPPALLATVSATNPLCHNNTNGAAAASVINSVGALSYTWLPTGPPTQTTQTASGLASGSYSLLVHDGNNCQASQTFTLTNPSVLVINTSINPASCSLSNGGITANPSGGTPGSPVPYTYSWAGVVSSSSVVTNIPAGLYTVTVSDGLGCTGTVSILLNNSSGPNVMPIVSSSITCFGQCTGAASVDISSIVGGTPSYTVDWLAPAPSTVNPLTGLCAGMYTAKILDAMGCIGFTNVTIAEPPSLTVTPVVSLPICPGICDGSVTINTSGGNTPYTYSWTPSSLSGSLVAGLCAGDYTVMVGYNGVCATTSIINMPDQSSITIVPSVTNNICYGTCTGVANLVITGGTAPYTAGWSNSQTGFSQTNLCNGSYTVSVTDNNGCTNTATTAITSGAQITSTTSVVSPSCGACNGSASVTASGGNLPLTYNWSTSANTPSISNVCAGIYQVIVSDAFSCSQTHTVIVNNSNGITGENVNLQQIPCSGSCVGAATVSAIGGTSPINYNWISPATSNSVISGLCPGTYFIQMSDALNCIRIASVTINPLVSLTVSPFVYLPACGASNGSISIVIAGGTPSYNIVWNPPAGQTTSLTNLFSGVYAYTVTESGTNSCSISDAINISNSSTPTLQTTQQNINCFGVCTGSISAVATGSNLPISYAWSTGATITVVTSLCKGVVTLTITDAANCKVLRTFTVTDNPLLQLGSSNVRNPVCYGDCDGIITLVPNGGVLPYTYTWTIPNANTNPMPGLCDGAYTATVKDAKGCLVTSPSFTIKSASSISLTAGTFSSSCSSAPDGSISVTPAGGIPTYTYTWQGPSNFTATSQNVANVVSGTYSVNVIDNLGCSKDTVLRVFPSFTLVTKAGDDRVICPETGTVLLNTGDAPGNATYKWFSVKDVLQTNALATGPSYLIKNLAEAEGYVLVATSTIASCFSKDTVMVNLYSLPPVDAGRDFTIPVYSTVTIGGQPSSWSASSLTWAPAMYLNDVSANNPVASNTVNVTYTLTVTDANGCVATDSMHVYLYPELNITSGITPNGDGKNDTWIIDYIDQFPATTVDIFNRWGDSVFSSTGYATPFDGRYKGAELPVGTYYYIIKLNHPGYPKPITGPLTIFR